jgi:hypothetical protein
MSFQNAEYPEPSFSPITITCGGSPPVTAAASATNRPSYGVENELVQFVSTVLNVFHHHFIATNMFTDCKIVE